MRGRQAAAPASAMPSTPAFRIGAVDDAAEREADAAADRVLRRKCGACDEEDRLSRSASGGAVADGAQTSVGAALAGAGQPLRAADAAFFGAAFGPVMGAVRVHDGPAADRAARGVGARAFALGQDVVFARGEYQPTSERGRRLLAHELAHVAQGGAALRRSAASCPTDWRSTVGDDDTRGRGMIRTARAKLDSYDGTNPPEVRTALARHFGGRTGTAFASYIRNVWLGQLLAVLWVVSPSYECEDTGSWWCSDGALAKTFWCVPGVAIRVCQPAYFGQGDAERSTTLIHEWFHKYMCRLDTGYEHEGDYGGHGTLRQILNADSFSSFVRDVQ